MKRGPRCVVVGVDSSVLAWVYGEVHAVPDGVDVALLEVVEDDGPSMSVVTGGLVLVIVAVVVGVDDDTGVVSENDGSTKLSGACSGSLNWRATNVTATMRMPITTTPTRLAPTTAGVRLYHGERDDSCSPWSSGPRPVTATDSSRGLRSDAWSAELRCDLGGEEIQVVKVGHVENLQVDPLDADL